MAAPRFPTAIRAYGVTPAILRCPLDNGSEQVFGHLSAAYDRFGVSYTYDELAPLVYPSLTSIADASTHTLLYDGAGANHGDVASERSPLVNCLSADLHVKGISKSNCENHKTTLNK